MHGARSSGCTRGLLGGQALESAAVAQRLRGTSWGKTSGSREHCVRAFRVHTALVIERSGAG